MQLFNIVTVLANAPNTIKAPHTAQLSTRPTCIRPICDLNKIDMFFHVKVWIVLYKPLKTCSVRVS